MFIISSSYFFLSKSEVYECCSDYTNVSGKCEGMSSCFKSHHTFRLVKEINKLTQASNVLIYEFLFLITLYLTQIRKKKKQIN